MHNPVGVSGNTGRVYFEESCEVVDYQLKSALKCVANRTKTPVCQCQNCSKRTFQGQHHVSDHTKGYAGDSGGIIVTYEDICTSKRKVTKNLDEVVRRSYISSHVKDNTLDSLQKISVLTWEMSDWFSICF